MKMPVGYKASSGGFVPGRLSVRAAPYTHQREAFHFAMCLFGAQGGDVQHSISGRGAALLMEM